jgi:acetoacetyl-CoA synthetase
MAVEQRREGDGSLVLLAVLREGAELDRELTMRIRKTIAARTTALHVPGLVVAVEALPVTHSGKRSERAGRDAVEGREAANRKALANPEALEQISGAVAAAEAVQAAGGIGALAEGASLREQVRAFWETALGLEGVGDDEDFFTLIRDRLGVELPLSALIEAPTIAELTAAIEDPGSHFQPLVQMRAGSDGPPLFLVHSIWGDVLGMRQIVAAMKTDVPVFGIRARGLNPGEAPLESIEEMARSYVELIRGQQPRGPYRLAGHSFGGLLAFEIARLLADQGEKIDWLGVIDAELDDRAHTPARRWGHRAAVPFHYARAAMRDPKASLKRLREVIPSLLRRGFSHFRSDVALAEAEATWMDGASEAHRHLAAHFLELAAAYRPRPYRGSMTYFLPTVRRFHLFADPLPVWRRITAGEIEIERVPGPHVGMIAGEAGRVVAAGIDRRLSG